MISNRQKRRTHRLALINKDRKPENWINSLPPSRPQRRAANRLSNAMSQYQDASKKAEGSVTKPGAQRHW